MVQQFSKICIVFCFRKVALHADQNCGSIPNTIPVNVVGEISIPVGVFKGVHVIGVLEQCIKTTF